MANRITVVARVGVTDTPGACSRYPVYGRSCFPEPLFLIPRADGFASLSAHRSRYPDRDRAATVRDSPRAGSISFSNHWK
jgi:hypothetical protein